MTKADLQEFRAAVACLADVRRRIAELERLRCDPESRLNAARRVLLELYQTEADKLQGSLRATEQALNALPDRLRQVMRLRYVDGYTAEQTAEQLYFSVNTVNRMQRKALALLHVRA